jgi:LysM repeat protein
LTENQIYRLKNIIFSLLFMLMCVHAFTQEQPEQIRKSTEKVIINGKVFYLHVVQQGQTVYSISRAYNVTLQDIATENPGIILEQVRPGMMLKIPVVTKADVLDPSYFGLKENDFIYHTVQQGENAYFLSKKYNVPLEVIYKYNPGTSTGVQIDQIIKIPKKKVLREITDSSRDDENYIYYKVKKNDTLYMLSQLYGVTVADIINSNPELRWGLKTGEFIKIPRLSQILSDTLQIAIDTLAADTLFQQIGPEECQAMHDTVRIKKVNVALLLPFFSDFTIELKKALDDTSVLNSDPNGVTFNRNKSSIKGEYYFEFYEGVLMALDSLRNAGLKCNLFVYDTEKDTNKVKSILDNLGTNVPDLIIGPVFPETFSLVADYAAKHHINVISPLYSRTTQLAGFVNAFQIVPSRETEFNGLAHFVSNRLKYNIILIHDTDTSNRKEVDLLKNTLFNQFNSDSVFDQVVFKEVRFNDSLLLNIKHTLVQDKKNLVIAISNNEAYISIVLSNLDENLKNYEIEVLGMPSWLGFRNIDLEYFHNLQVTLLTSFFIDYNDVNTRHFLKKCKDILGYEPQDLKSKGYNLTFLGYDITFFFIKAYATYGKDFQKCIKYLNVKSLLGNYQFVQKSPANGFENNNMIYIRYNKDFTISKVYPENMVNGNIVKYSELP